MQVYIMKNHKVTIVFTVYRYNYTLNMKDVEVGSHNINYNGCRQNYSP